MSVPEKDSRGGAEARSGSESLGDVEILDLRGLKCPLPALFAKRRLHLAKPGETIIVLTDDPLAPVDIPHMCSQEGFAHVSTEKNGALSHITLRR